MLQSQLFTKTRKEAPKDEVAKNAELLIRGGYINKEMAGVYSYLPLGLRVMEKIVAIIREEMNAIGGQELLLTALQDPAIWQTSGRWSDEVIDVWFKTKLATKTEVGLANTHEEAMTALMKSFIQSYQDLPRYAYQFQTKFRNELRAKSGIMRTREFIMKDLYSFSRTQAELDEFYDRCAEAYMNIFRRVGLGDRTYFTFASGGAFSKYSHEFQTICDAGEDTIYLAADKNIAINIEVCTPEVLADLGLTKEELVPHKAIEVGNIFKLGTRFSEPLGLTFTNEAGERQPVIMGSYGVGPGRLLGTVVEVLADEKGIVWPKAIAPFMVHLVSLAGKSEDVLTSSRKIYDDLVAEGVEVLWDDRVVSAGEKFADSDLLGMPYRVVVSDRSLANNEVEVKERRSGETAMCAVDELSKYLAEHA